VADHEFREAMRDALSGDEAWARFLRACLRTGRVGTAEMRLFAFFGDSAAQGVAELKSPRNGLVGLSPIANQLPDAARVALLRAVVPLIDEFTNSEGSRCLAALEAGEDYSVPPPADPSRSYLMHLIRENFSRIASGVESSFGALLREVHQNALKAGQTIEEADQKISRSVLGALRRELLSRAGGASNLQGPTKSTPSGNESG